MKKFGVFASAFSALAFAVMLNLACGGDGGNTVKPGGNGNGQDTSGITTPPPDTGTVMPQDNGDTVIPIIPSDSSDIIPQDSTDVIPPDTAVVIPPDSGDTVIPIIPSDSSDIVPQDSTDVIPPDTAVIIPPDSGDTVIPIIPSDSSDIIPRDSADVTPPDTGTVIPQDTTTVTPPDTAVVPPPPPMSPRDSILDYIDRNWQSYGYASKPTRYAALTFDDGPSAQTGNLLAALSNKNVKATFFLIGQNVRSNQSQAKAIHDAGHELANHSDGYSGLGGNTATGTISTSLTAASAAIKNITGKDVKLFRAPNVEYGNNLTTVCAQQGLAIIGVSVWSQDYQSGISSSAISGNVVNNAADGGIINCHEPNTAPNTVAAIPSMIDGLRQKGFWICTVSDLAILKGKTLQAGVQYDRVQ